MMFYRFSSSVPLTIISSLVYALPPNQPTKHLAQAIVFSYNLNEIVNLP